MDFVAHMMPVVGSVVLLVTTISLVFGSRHPTAIVFVAAFGLVLCGAFFFQSVGFGKDGLDVKFKVVAEDIAELAAKNGEAIKSISKSIEEIRGQLALTKLSTSGGTSGGRVEGDNLIFPSDSLWGGFIDSDFCKNNPKMCEGIREENNSIVVPKKALDENPWSQDAIAQNIDRTQELIKQSDEIESRIQDNLKVLQQSQ